MKSYMKKLIVPLFICLSLFGCGNNDTQKHNTDMKNSQNIAQNYPEILDNLENVTNSDLQAIAEKYEICYGIETPLKEDEITKYSWAFKYMYSGGAYRLNPSNLDLIPDIDDYYNPKTGIIKLPKAVAEKSIANGIIQQLEIESFEIIDGNYIIDKETWSLRPELRPYWIKSKCQLKNVPAKIIDDYLLSKFNTEIDYSEITEYDATSKTYTFAPHMGSWQHDIKVDSKKFVDNKKINDKKLEDIWEVNLMAFYDHSDVYAHQFPVKMILQVIDGEYRFISMTQNWSSISFDNYDDIDKEKLLATTYSAKIRNNSYAEIKFSENVNNNNLFVDIHLHSTKPDKEELITGEVALIDEKTLQGKFVSQDFSCIADLFIVNGELYFNIVEVLENKIFNFDAFFDINNNLGLPTILKAK